MHIFPVRKWLICVLPQVLERGYNIQDEVFLHREQRGKLPGVEAIPMPEDRKWAAAGLEGKIVRRCHRAFDLLSAPSPLAMLHRVAMRAYITTCSLADEIPPSAFIIVTQMAVRGPAL
jgi:hypothetical protein